MKKKLIILFSATFILSIGIAYQILSWQQRQVELNHEHQTTIIQDDIRERFKLLIESPLAIGIVSAEYFSSGQMDAKSYEQLANNIIHNFDEMLGLNVLDAEGRITKVYPIKDNISGLGKVSQNYEAFLTSAKNGETYWLSAPFKLYQGPIGFTFYIPIYVKGKLFGWVAPVISVDRFFRKFIRSEFLENYHLIVKDTATGESYFQTAPLPEENGKKINQLSAEIKGRKIDFISWQKASEPFSYAFPISFILGFFFATIITYSYILFEQKRFIRDQLSDIESLLKLTIQDASSSFHSIRGQLDLMRAGVATISLEKISKHFSYIETLMKQVEILQNMSSTVELNKRERTTLLPLFLELSTIWQEKLNEKKLLLNYDPEQLADARIAGNKWLICHSIFGNIIAKAIYTSPVGSDINIKCINEKGFHLITFDCQLDQRPPRDGVFSQGILIAQKVTQLHRGELIVDSKAKDKETVTVKLSAQ